MNQVLKPELLMDQAMEAAQTLAERPGFILSTIKGLINEGLDMPLESALAHEMRCFELLFSTQDKKEGIKAFVEKRKPVFQHQ